MMSVMMVVGSRCMVVHAKDMGFALVRVRPSEVDVADGRRAPAR
jgi:hypothetical protein